MKKMLSVFAMLAMVLLALGCSSQGGSNSSATAGSQGASSDDATKSYTIVHVDSAPDWGSIAQLDIDDAEWTDSFGIGAHAKLCYDDQAIYVCIWAEEQDIRATYTPSDPLAKCYEDSCLEFFLSPVADDTRYLNFEFNPNCAVCNEIGAQKENRIRLFSETEVFNASSSRTENGWEITYRIPLDYIQTLYPDFGFKAGMQVRGNFYKCGNLTKNKHYLVWNHVDSETPNFHVPSSFGILVFE